MSYLALGQHMEAWYSPKTYTLNMCILNPKQAP
jgi:hypothetical protein